MIEKYDPSSLYLFDCKISISGIKANAVEKQIVDFLKKIIKENNPNFVSLSNECSDKKIKKMNSIKVLEELEFMKNGEIIHFGTIPQIWMETLKKEMKEKNELDQKRVEALDDCIIICVKKDGNISSMIIDRKGIYSISKNSPEY